MIFLCREENDIDAMLENGTIYDYIEGLEKSHLESTLKVFRDRGLDTKEIEDRLAVLNEEEKTKNND